MLNPKVALFFLAFLPQFIDPASGTRILAFLLLGADFLATGFLWCLVLAAAAARLQAFFLRNPKFRVDRRSGRGEPVRRAGRAPGVVALSGERGAARIYCPHNE